MTRLHVYECPGCGAKDQDVFGAIHIPPREYEFITGNRQYTKSRRRRGYLVAMPCCCWAGWVRHRYGAPRVRTQLAAVGGVHSPYAIGGDDSIVAPQLATHPSWL